VRRAGLRIRSRPGNTAPKVLGKKKNEEGGNRIEGGEQGPSKRDTLGYGREERARNHRLEAQEGGLNQWTKRSSFPPWEQKHAEKPRLEMESSRRTLELVALPENY